MPRMAFLDLQDPTDLDKALELDGTEFKKTEIHVDKANTRKAETPKSRTPQRGDDGKD